MRLNRLPERRKEVPRESYAPALSYRLGKQRQSNPQAMAAMTGIGLSPFRPKRTCSRSVCSDLREVRSRTASLNIEYHEQLHNNRGFMARLKTDTDLRSMSLLSTRKCALGPMNPLSHPRTVRGHAKRLMLGSSCSTSVAG